MPTSSACTRPGSASIISTRSACSPVPISCSPISRRAPSTSGSRPAVTVLPLHHPIRVAEQWATLDLLSGGRVDFAAGRGYDRARIRAVPRLVRRQPGHLRRGHGNRPASCGRRTGRSRITASTISSTTSASRRSRCRSRSRPMSARSRSRRSNWPRGLGCGLIVAPFAAAMSYGGLRAGGRPLPRDLRQARQQAGPADVQLLHPFRRQQARRRTRSARGRSATTRNA